MRDIDEDQMVNQILATWETWLSGGDPQVRREMAELAVRTRLAVPALDGPREWSAGDTIPDGVHLVATGNGTVFRRDQWPDGWVLQSEPIPEEELLTELGPVHEASEASTEEARNSLSKMTGCGTTGQASVDVPARLGSPPEPVLACVTAILDRAQQVLDYIAAKTGVHDAAACRGAARGCRAASAALRDLSLDSLFGGNHG